ncbi:MAG TPA: rhodanese-like domain-containing protein [Verrucomicrobiae bacterium]|nr:rhodanese-like domain-containing protein [Verrucomicrobiae bacterium]
MKTFISTRPVSCAIIMLGTLSAFAISPAQVRQLLDSGEKITFVDVRLNTVFQSGHIPGAINIPAKLVPEKQLPPIGHVIVCDDGIHLDAAAAAAALNQKTGINAEVLDGGYAAWETERSETTGPGGMKEEKSPLITYAELQKIQSSDVVLVDLRKAAPSPAKALSLNPSGKNIAPPALTDLQAEFPKARVSRSPFAESGGGATLAKSASSAAPPLLVLIDSGDGSAQRIARALKANGITRFAILAGGEKILSVHGEPGLQRIGSSVTVRKASADSSQPATP